MSNLECKEQSLVVTFDKFVEMLTMREGGLGPGSGGKFSQIIQNVAALEDVL